jgi:hypothetical protein
VQHVDALQRTDGISRWLRRNIFAIQHNRPAREFFRPLMQRSSVDLPVPERPMMATISPFSALRLTDFEASVPLG